jgi:hypothetical protein
MANPHQALQPDKVSANCVEKVRRGCAKQTIRVTPTAVSFEHVVTLPASACK